MKVLIVILLIIVAIVGGVFFAISTTAQVDVQWTEQDYQSYLQKVGAASGANTDAADNKDANDNKDNTDNKDSNKGSNQAQNPGVDKATLIDMSFTNAEISAMVSKECAASKESLVKDVKIKFLPGNQLEATFVTTDKLKQLIPKEQLEKYKVAENLIANRPVYVKMKVEKASSKTISLNLQDAKVGQIGIPASALGAAEGAIESAVNSRLQQLNYFSIDEMSFDDNNAKFKGSLQSAPRALP